MNTFTLEGGQKVHNVHSDVGCSAPCPIHYLSDHSMRGFPQNFRENGLMERICPHGVGHPDPDALPYFESLGLFGFDVHGCDGCCA